MNASFSQRLLAYNLDITILIFLVLPVSFLVEDNLTLYLIVILLICLYHALFECSAWQATPGKKQGKLKVVRLDGKALDFPQAFLRIVCKFLSLLLFFSGFFMIYFRKDRRGLHDLLARTMVVVQ